MDTRKLFSFDGRISRAPYWYLVIATTVVSIISSILFSTENTLAVILGLVLLVPLIVVSLAASIKRWHDRDKSGWWILITLVPIIGGIWALVEQGFLSGTPGANRFGSPNDGSPFGG